MQLNQQTLTSAVQAGLALTDPESDLLEVFRKHPTGIMILRSILNQVGTGQLAITPVKEAPEPSEGKDA